MVNIFTGNRVLSYGGRLSLTQRFNSDYNEMSRPETDIVLVGGDKSIYFRNPNTLRSGESLVNNISIFNNLYRFKFICKLFCSLLNS